MEREYCCCFSGHRPVGLPWRSNESDPRCQAIKLELAARLEAIYSLGYRHFMCGMALGCDMYFAEAVLEMKNRNSDVYLEAVIPCGDQADRWNAPQRERYNRIIDLCDKVTVLQYKYTPDCMLRRNRYMVDHSSLLLSCFSGNPGGTMNTLLYAQRSGIKTVIIEI